MVIGATNNIEMLLTWMFIWFFVNPVPLEAMSSLDFQFPFTLEFVETNRLNWLTGISVRLGSSIASLGHFFRFKRSIDFNFQHPTVPNTRGKTDLGLRMGSHCAYVGPDRGIGLVNLAQYVQIAGANCLNGCQSNYYCSYWQYSGNTCTWMAIDYPTKSGEISGYCTEGKLSQCSINAGYSSFTNYKQLNTPNSGDCMEACFQDVTKCINWNWNIGGVCKLYRMKVISSTNVHSGSCANKEIHYKL